MYQRWIHLTRCALLACAVAIPAARAEVIRSFDADITLRRDASLSVTETIAMDFEGAERHGIFRDIPVRYDRKGKPYTLDLRLLDVTEDDGRPAEYQTSDNGRDLRIRIGSPDRSVSGLHTYVIRYSVRRAVNFFGGEPEVYWNATGNGWPFTIERAVARFRPPAGVPVAKLRATGFAGAVGSRNTPRLSRTSGYVVFSAAGLSPSEGLTFAVRLPKGSIKPPPVPKPALRKTASVKKAPRRTRVSHGGYVGPVDTMPYGGGPGGTGPIGGSGGASAWPAAGIPVLTLAGMVALWRSKGRDVDGDKPVAVEWDPPTELSPAEAGTLLDEQCDTQDIVSTLIDLAVRGFVHIRAEETKVLFFFSNRDYVFTRLATPNGDTLSAHERLFLSGVFDGRGPEVRLSDLREKFYTHLPGIREAVYEELMAKRAFTGNPESTRAAYIALGALLFLVGAVAGFLTRSLPLVFAFGLSGLIIMAMSGAMPARSAVGSAMLRRLRGFQRFVRLVEKDRIAVLAKDDPTLFGRLLPYAMVLGVADQWAEAFKDLVTEPPDWYVPVDGGAMFSATAFIADLNGGMSTMESTFASSPQPSSSSSHSSQPPFSGSSASSGGSGFSSSAGSGGGFGGGGGGSW